MLEIRLKFSLSFTSLFSLIFYLIRFNTSNKRVIFLVMEFFSKKAKMESVL